MKKQLAYFLACAYLLLVSDCTPQTEEPRSTPCTFKKDKNKRLDNTYPFDKATKIEAISFDLEKFFEDLEIKNGNTNISEWSIKIENNILHIPNVLNRYTLTPKQTQSLFEILVFYQGENEKGRNCDIHVSDHLLVFYEGNRPFAYLELSLRCSEKVSVNCDFGNFCEEKWQKLATFFPAEKKGN